MTKENIFSNFIWRFLERIGAQVVTFIVSIVVARIVGPDVYGTVAIIMVVTNILSVFIDSGLGTALIQKNETDDVDYSTVFYFNLVMSLLLYFVVFICSPQIASFYNNSELIVYIRVSALMLFISGFRNVQVAYVSRELLFKKFFLATIIGTIIAAIMGIIMAICGFGIWALIVQNLINLFVDTIMLYVLVEWRPRFVFSLKRLKFLFTYGVKILLAGLLDMIFKELRTIVIGKNYLASDLAYFNKGEQFPRLIAQDINSSMDNVLLSVLSKENSDIYRVRDMTRKSIKMGSYILWPIMMGLAACSESFILLILGEKWIFCVPYIRIFCFMYVFYPIISTNGEVIKALGRSDIFLKLNVVNNIIGIVSLLITMNISVKAIAFSSLVWTVLSQIINSIPNKKLINYSYIEQMKDILPSILLSIFMGIIVYLFGSLPLDSVIVLFIQVCVGILIYILGSYILKYEEFFYLIDLISKLLEKRHILVPKKSNFPRLL